MRIYTRFIVAIFLFLSASCRTGAPASSEEASVRPVRVIPLPPPLNAPDEEFSSLTWCENQLVLLPQFPAGEAATDTSAQLYAIPKADLAAYLQESVNDALSFRNIPIHTDGIRDSIPGFEGFEAILFYEDEVFLTIESQVSSSMRGYLIKGAIEPGCASIRLDVSSLLALPRQTGQPGFTYETLLHTGNSLLVLHEASGAEINKSPTAFAVDTDLQTLRPVPFPSLEYRVTDAAGADADGRFWIINYYYPGERDILQPVADPLLSRFSLPVDTSQSRVIERLVQLQYHPNGITLTETPPIYLQRSNPDLPARNWEGLALWPGKGFFIVTDTYPETMLAFVPHPPSPPPDQARAE